MPATHQSNSVHPAGHVNHVHERRLRPLVPGLVDGALSLQRQLQLAVALLATGDAHSVSAMGNRRMSSLLTSAHTIVTNPS